MPRFVITISWLIMTVIILYKDFFQPEVVNHSIRKHFIFNFSTMLRCAAPPFFALETF